MRVAHIITRLIIGGAQENTLFTVDGQHHRHGDQVCLMTGPARGPEGSLEDRARQRGLDLRIIPPLRRNLSPWYDFHAYRAVKRALRDYRPDLVHTHSSKAGILGRRAAWSLGIPCVHTIHGASFHYGQPRLLYEAYRTAERMAANWCQHFITVCDAMTRQYVEAGIAPESKFTTVYSGMDVDRFLQPPESPQAVRRRLGLADDDIVVVKVARLFSLKGHEYLIEAAPRIVAAVPRVRFVFVGDGILREQYEQQIRRLGLQDHFVFVGLVPPDHVSSYVHAADIVAHTSVWEGLARVLVQGLLAGRPVVSFDIDGAPEVCLDGQTGILVPPRRTTPLADAIIRLAEDETLRHRLGETGRRKFTEPFRHEYMTQRIRDVYEQVLSRWSGSCGSG